jgi:hypothetical protein
MRSVAAVVLRFASVLVLFVGPRVPAQGAQPFDVAATGSDSGCIIVLPFDGPSLQFLGSPRDNDPPFVMYLGPAGEGRVLGLQRPRSSIVEVRPDGTRTPFFAGIDGTDGHRFVVDAAQNIYIATEDGQLFAIRPDGTIRADFALGIVTMDLAADQCTLFYATPDGTVRRFNVCTGTALSDFVAAAVTREIRLLPDGGLLRLGSDAEVVRYDAAGNPVRTYPIPQEASALALGRAGRTMFVGDECNSGTVREYNLDTGSLLRTFDFGFSFISSLVAYNSFTAALGPTAAAHVAAVPSLSGVALVLLGALLALIAFRRLV